ncbi:succinylglutamate desuccinylase/aspartoacylase family protein [Desulforhopalus sp. IMCC35007]|uniref:succinylglutamate desuccinylase/aspartoacylase family protein n=1 Tax=Desulforhopalus sp. IMCC35007 TaxID=2569543 RepID=UPI0010AEC4D9|nr:succinylglutamate desuccinylase/aspartoacylase family protein [Desulforhopalus sp. IMCC35007]TKB11685.1 succinylglutamate desuccinylase/aspartoacylase family protein [Desulforhopalus sp. IMCC35007]
MTDGRDLKILDYCVPPGTRQNIEWLYPHVEGKAPASMVVHLVNGIQPGPVLCLTAAIHGDELNGIAIIRKIVDGLDPAKLAGAVVGIPVVNLDGFILHNRYISGHIDLNRCFPGDSLESYAHRVAHGIFKGIIVHCDGLVDIHTGSSLRENMVQLRADLSCKDVAQLSAGFGNLGVMQSCAAPGTLRRAATDAGIAALTMEVGGSHGIEYDKVCTGVEGLLSLLKSYGMIGEKGFTPDSQHVYLGGGWIRAEFTGILANRVELGTVVVEGTVLAEIFDPFSSEIHLVRAPFDCTVLGRAHSQQVEVGFALFRVAMEQRS